VSLLVIAVLAVAVWTDGHPLEQLSERVRWTEIGLGVMAVFVPVFIFGSNILLIIYGLAFFWGIFMIWFCFVRHFLSNDMKRMREAEENAEESAREETKKAGSASSFSDKAKRVLKEHPEWTNEAVADHCGFTRTHFQKIFKQETGVAPSEYVAKQ